MAGRSAAKPLHAPTNTSARLGDALHAKSNYRSPRPIVELLRKLLPGDLDIEAASPIADESKSSTMPTPCRDVRRAKEAIRLCYSAGFKKHDLAIVSYHGREQSR